VCVTNVFGLGVLSVIGKLWRWGAVGTTPLHELLFAVLVFGLCFIEPLQRAVVALIQTPVTDNWDPVTVCRIQRNIGSADRATQQGGVHNSGQVIAFYQHLPATLCFCLTLFGEIHIDPTGELVGFIPRGLAMA